MTWAGDWARAGDVAKKLRAGTVWVNNWHQVGPAMPFGGYK